LAKAFGGGRGGIILSTRRYSRKKREDGDLLDSHGGKKNQFPILPKTDKTVRVAGKRKSGENGWKKKEMIKGRAVNERDSLEEEFTCPKKEKPGLGSIEVRGENRRG